MAKPRVFLSSTYYDLRHVRADLGRFIREMGYEPVRNERGNVPYGSEKKLEEYCYKDIEHCDILVSIIGGRYGSASKNLPHSISHMELKTALELGKQVYIFIDKEVYSEFKFYVANKDNEKTKYNSIDNIEIFGFIEEVENLPKNNTIFAFETSGDIIEYLKEQWAGLFQIMLQEQVRKEEARILESMKATARTLDGLVTYLKEENEKGSDAIKSILLSNHPAFERLRHLLNVKPRVFFTNYSELVDWLTFRMWAEVPEEHWENPNIEEWVYTLGNKSWVIHIPLDIFDEQKRLKVFTPEEWERDKIYLKVFEEPPEEETDDIPF